MKVLHLCYSDLAGGAARAAYRLHIAQRKFGMDSHMLVINKLSDDPYVHSVSKRKQLWIKGLNYITNKFLKLQKYNNNVFHSINIIPSGLIKYINHLSPDIVNLHWVGSNMLSISEIARIQQPVVWTLHDMWAFSGCEHYEDLNNINRYRCDYNDDLTKNKNYVDLNKIIFKFKRNKFKKNKITIITPSNWLGECAKNSSLFKKNNVVTISNCIDHTVFKPVDKLFSREVLGLPEKVPLILFGAMASTSDIRKGYMLLKIAMQKLKERNVYFNCELVVFGANKKNEINEFGIKTHYVGNIVDDATLCLLYSAADAFIAPSLQDNLPNTLVESLACGTPCIAFNIGGMPDLIPSKAFGQLVDDVDSGSLADAIYTQLSSEKKFDAKKLAMQSAILRDEEVVASRYLKVYNDILSELNVAK